MKSPFESESRWCELIFGIESLDVSANGRNRIRLFNVDRIDVHLFVTNRMQIRMFSFCIYNRTASQKIRNLYLKLAKAPRLSYSQLNA